MSEFQDIERPCRSCGAPYVWTAGEQKWYAARDFKPPTRCPSCRQLAKQQRTHGPDYVSHVERGRDA